MSHFWVGIDVAKRKLDIALLDGAGKVKSKVVANDPAGFAALMTWLGERGADATSTHVCLESTGIYSDGCATAFADAGWKVSVVNPALPKDFGKSELIAALTAFLGPGVLGRSGRGRSCARLCSAAASKSKRPSNPPPGLKRDWRPNVRN